MEIKVNIPKNDYVQPTEVRQEVVQGICEAFLGGCAWSMFHPFTNGRYAFKKPTLNILKHKGEKAFYGFYYKKPFADDEMVSFNGAEMKVAFRALRDAGYHIFGHAVTKIGWGTNVAKNLSWRKELRFLISQIL